MSPVHDPRFGAELRRLRDDSGLSLRDLGRRASCSPSYLSELEHGTRRPGADVARALDEALHARGRLAGLVTDTPYADDDALTAAAANPRRIDRATINSMRLMLTGQRHLDDSIGSAPLVAPVTATLTTVTAMVTDATGPIRADLLDVAAQYAQFAGWLHTTGARWGLAKQWFGTALEWATEIGDRDMIATVMSYEGHVAWLTGQPGPVIGLSRAARRDPGIYPGQLAYDAYQEARGLAVTGQVEAALSVLAEADDLSHVCAEWTGPVPDWQYYRAPWFFHLEKGLVYRFLARHDHAYAQRAVGELAAGIDGVPPEWSGAEWVAEYLCHLAVAHRDTGNQPAAERVAGEARLIAQATGSARVHAMAERSIRR
jgi:transcriptional regulator with XRE-family HTH domain